MIQKPVDVMVYPFRATRSFGASAKSGSVAYLTSKDSSGTSISIVQQAPSIIRARRRCTLAESGWDV